MLADYKNRFEQNVPGQVYVDDQCIACDACVVEAPKFFEMNDQEGHAYVKLQPQSESDWKDAQAAVDACPVDAIGLDGEKV